MKHFLQVTMLLIMALSGTSTLKAQWYPDGLSYIYRGESFEDENFVYKRYSPEDNYVFLAASDFTRANAERLVFPTEVTYNGQTFEVAGIAHGGFEDCKNLKEVIFPESDYFFIGWSAFWGCSALGPSLTIPGTIDYSLGWDTFSECSSLEEIRFGKSDEIIEIDTHGGIESSYTSGQLPVKTLVTGRDIKFDVVHRPSYPGRDSTVCLSNLRDLKILDGTNVSNLFKFTRWHVVNLFMGKDVTGLPASLADHTKLKTITINSSVPPVCPAFTDEQYKNIILTVPERWRWVYRSTEGWKNFVNIYESGIDAPAVEPSERTLTGRYDLHGRPVADDYRGLVIERYSDGTAAKKIIGR